jgi:hypothetical protein
MNAPNPAVFVLSSHAMYFLNVVGKEWEAASNWLTLQDTKPLEQVSSITKLVGDLGLYFQFTGQSQKNPGIIFLVGDQRRTDGLLQFISGNIIIVNCRKIVSTLNFCLDRVGSKITDKLSSTDKRTIDPQMCALETAMQQSGKNEDVDPCLIFFSLGYCKLTDG